MRINQWIVLMLLMCFTACFAGTASAEACQICGGNSVCNTCQGVGYQIMESYDSSEQVRVKCAAGCDDGRCPECFVPCEVCDSDGLCNICSGLGYLTMIAYDTDDEVRVTCPGEFCTDGTCSTCRNAIGKEEANSGVPETMITEYTVKGFQTMKIAIELDSEGKIVSIKVLEHNETPGFGADLIADASVFDALVGQDIATAQIDVKSYVTLTCNAINDALKQAAAASGYDSETSAKESTVSVYNVQGFQPMKVAVEVDEVGKIVSVEVVEHNETAGFGADLINDSAVFDALVGQDIATAQIDARTYATMTSNAINDALRQAAGHYTLSSEHEDDSEEIGVTKEESDSDPLSKMTEYPAGQYKVGLDIPSGEYVLLATGSTAAYFSVSNDANGDDILFNDNFETNSIIEIRNGEYVELKRCIAIDSKEFHSEYSINEDNYGVMLKVGYDIWPGEYKLVAQPGKSGYYCIYNDARHDDIEANDNFDSSSYVSVKMGQYLILNRCKIMN